MFLVKNPQILSKKDDILATINMADPWAYHFNHGFVILTKFH